MWKELGQKSAKISYKDVFKAPSFVDTSSVWNAPSVTETKTDYSASTPALDPAHAQNVLAETELIKNLQPLYLEQAKQYANLQAALSGEQIRQLYPALSAAAAESTARNLAASQTYRRFTEQLPSSVQSIMASKQSQVQSAQAGEAALQQATALQQQAAKDFAGKFAGQYISYS